MADVTETYRIVGENAVGAAFRQILSQSKSTADRMTNIFRGAFAGISVAAITRIAANTIKAGDDLAKFAEKSGLAAEAASELAHAAEMTDVELGSLELGVRTMQQTLSEAGTGSKAALKLLDALGIELEQIRKLSPDRQFELMADGISHLKDPADRARAAVEAFGRSGADLLPLFSNGAQGIREAREEAQRLGKSFSDSDLRKFQEVDEAFKSMTTSASAFADSLVLKAAPALTTFFNAMRMATGNTSPAEDLALEIARLEKLGYLWGEGGLRLHELRAKLLETVTDDRIAATIAKSRLMFNTEATGFKPEDKATKPPTEKELAEWERFLNLQEQIAATITVTDYSGKQAREFRIHQVTESVAASEEALLLSQAIAPSLAENTAAINAAMAEIIESNTIATQRTVELGQAFEEQMSQISIYSDQAARNMQDAFAQFLFDPFDDGLKGMLRNFTNVIRQMAAQAAAAHIFQSTGFGGFLSDVFGTIFGAGTGTDAAASYSGTRAAGGPIRPGEWAIVGERGPEIAVGGTSGQTIVPFAKAEKRRNVTVSPVFAPVINVDSRSDRAAVRQDMESIARGMFAQYHEFWRDQLARGAFSP